MNTVHLSFLVRVETWKCYLEIHFRIKVHVQRPLFLKVHVNYVIMFVRNTYSEISINFNDI